jgi:hypothetical protein
MKTWIIALVFVAACAASPPAAQTSGSGGQSSEPSYEDARSTATDAEVRDARRAYRSACQTRHSDAYCECMTGGMAQVLPPADLAIATAAFTGQTVQASQEARDRVAARRTEVDRGCAQIQGLARKRRAGGPYVARGRSSPA